MLCVELLCKKEVSRGAPDTHPALLELDWDASSDAGLGKATAWPPLGRLKFSVENA